MRPLPCLAALTLVLATAACGSNGSGHAVDPAPDDPTTPASFPPTALATISPNPLGPAPGRTPSGYRRQVCHLDTGHGTLAFGYDVPADYRSHHHGCSAGKHVHIDVDDGYNGQIGLTVTWVGDKDELTHEYGQEFRFTEAGGEPQGDDSIEDLVFHPHAPVFGTTGSTLTDLCYCDGQEVVGYDAQAGGVLVRWSLFPQFRATVTKQFAQLMASGGKS